MKRQATFRILHFPKLDRFVGLAWNYDQAVLLSTSDYPNYTGARKALELVCNACNVELKWFDGEYDVVDELIIPK